MAYEPEKPALTLAGQVVTPNSNLGVTDEESNTGHDWCFDPLGSGPVCRNFPPASDSASRIGRRSGTAVSARSLPHEVTFYLSEPDEQSLSGFDIFLICGLPWLLLIPCILVGWYVSKLPPMAGNSGGFSYLTHFEPLAWALACLFIAAGLYCWRKDFLFLNRYYRKLIESIDFSEAEDVRPISREGEPK